MASKPPNLTSGLPGPIFVKNTESIQAKEPEASYESNDMGIGHLGGAVKARPNNPRLPNPSPVASAISDRQAGTLPIGSQPVGQIQQQQSGQSFIDSVNQRRMKGLGDG